MNQRKLKQKIKRAKKALTKMDKLLLIIVFAWIFFGMLTFISASMAYLGTRSSMFSDIIIKQFVFLLLSIILLFLVANIKFKTILSLSPAIFIASVLLSALVFVPGIGFSHGGATRWLTFAGFSIQPAEFMKYASVLFYVYLLFKYKKEVLRNENFALFLLLASVVAPFAILYMQPDTSTLLVILFGLTTVYFLRGAPWKNLLIIFVIGVSALSYLVISKPYIKDRILVFLDSNKDVLGKSYQINQSLIAIGSGGLWGKGYGQGIQKYGYLPEPAGDSVFATLGEEFGFIGSALLLIVISLFVMRSFKLALLSKSLASSLVISSFALMIFIQSVINIASMTALAPLTGLTLPFFSLGGTSMLATSLAIGVIFSASKSK